MDGERPSPPDSADLGASRALLTEHVRAYKARGRIQLALAAFTLLLIAGLGGLMLLLVDSIFDEVTPAVRADLQWKASRGVVELAHSLEVAIAAQDAKMVESLAADFIADPDVSGLLVIDTLGAPLFSRGRLPSQASVLGNGAPQGSVQRDDQIWAWSEVRIESVQVGRVGLAITLERLNTGFELKRRVLLLVAAGCVAGLLASFVFFKLRIDPLLKLVQQALTSLEQTTAVALESTRLKSEFIANMSHEIRTPMNGVIGMTELMLTTPLSAQQHRYLSTIAKSVHSLMTIINDILDFSKIEAHKLELRPLDCQIVEVVEDVAALFGEQAHAKRLELASYVGRSVPRQVFADAHRIRQVLTNLVSNAVKFTERGEIVIHVSCVGGPPERPLVRFEVRDTGVGIAPDDLTKLFRAFSQLDASLTRRHGGTGLGLAISRNLVELMGGSLGVTSTPGVGSRFSFEIAVEVSHDRQTPLELEPAELLVVDDDTCTRRALVELLTDWGLTVEAVATCREARLALQQTNPQRPLAAVIIDLEAADPEIATLQLRSEPAPVAPRMLFLSRYGGPRPTESALAPGDRVLMKPLRQADLMAALSRSRTSRNPQQTLPPSEPSGLPEVSDPAGPILLVEDHPLNQHVLSEQITALGYTIDVVGDGQSALSKLETTRYGIVLMDCQMPKLDGFETTRRWRNLEHATGRARVPILAVTAHALEAERRRALAAGMDGFIAKPVQAQTLREQLRHWLGEPAEPPVGARVEQTAQTQAAHGARPATEGMGVSSLPLLNAQVPRTARMLSLFAEQGVEDADRIQEAAAVSDTEILRRAAHRLKGASLAFGAERLAASLEQLERLAQQPDFDLSEEGARVARLFRETLEASETSLRV